MDEGLKTFILWGAGVTSASVIFKFILFPLGRGIFKLVRGIDKMDTVVPVLIDIGTAFKPNGKPSLPDRIDNFGRDMKALSDAVARAALEAEAAKRAANAAKELNAEQAGQLKIQVAEMIAIALENKGHLTSLTARSAQHRASDRLDAKQVTETLQGLLMEAQKAAQALEGIKEHGQDVASDLAASHERADAVSDSEPGAAADAAAQSSPKETE